MTPTSPPQETATPAPTDTAAAAGEATPQATGGTEQPPAVPTEAPAALQEPLEAAEGLKKAIAPEGSTASGIVQRLDSYAIDAGGAHISVWSAAVVLMILVGVILLARLGTTLARSLIRRIRRLDATQKLLSEKLASIFIWVLTVLIGVDLLGIDLTALAFFSGAFGLAIGFGLQKTFGNLIAGIILLMDRSIKPGDVISVADSAGNSTFGQIRKIGIRAVSIVTRDKKEYLIPNENLMINQVENWSYSSREVRVQVPVGVSYLADIDKATELMLQAAKSCKRVLASPPPTIWLDAYGDSSVNFIIHCWITDPEQGVGNVKSEVLTTLWHLFQEQGIEIPFPQRDINLRDGAALRELIAAIGAKTDSKPTKTRPEGDDT